MKVYELARELSISCRDLLDILSELECPQPASHFAALPDDQAEAVRRHFIRRVVSLPSPAAQEEEKTGEEAPPAKPLKPAVIVRRKKAETEGGHPETERRAIPPGGRRFSPPKELLGMPVAAGRKREK